MLNIKRSNTWKRCVPRSLPRGPGYVGTVRSAMNVITRQKLHMLHTIHIKAVLREVVHLHNYLVEISGCKCLVFSFQTYSAHNLHNTALQHSFCVSPRGERCCGGLSSATWNKMTTGAFISQNSIAEWPLGTFALQSQTTICRSDYFSILKTRNEDNT